IGRLGSAMRVQAVNQTPQRSHMAAAMMAVAVIVAARRTVASGRAIPAGRAVTGRYGRVAAGRPAIATVGSGHAASGRTITAARAVAGLSRWASSDSSRDHSRTRQISKVSHGFRTPPVVLTTVDPSLLAGPTPSFVTLLHRILARL